MKQKDNIIIRKIKMANNKNNESTVRGWVVRTDDGRLHLMSKEDDIPALGMELHNCSDMFRELTFNDDPVEVQVTITKI